MRIPLIKVRDKFDGYEHIVGAYPSDTLLVDKEGNITYYNMQNSEGTGPHGVYEFVTIDDEYFKMIPFTDEVDGKFLADKQQVEMLERLYEAVKNWRYGLIDKQCGGDISRLACTYPAIYRLAATFDEVERALDRSTKG